MDKPNDIPNVAVDEEGNTIVNPAGEDSAANKTATPPVDDTAPAVSSAPADGQPSLDILQHTKDNITNPTLPNGGTVNPVSQVAKDGEIVDPNKYKLGPAGTGTANTADALGAGVLQELPKFGQVDTATIGADNAPKVTAAHGTLSEDAQVKAAQQDGLSTDLKNTFKTFDDELAAIGVDPNATVQEQYKKLTDFSNGVPAWAQGAMTQAQQIMAKRGLGNSSVAGGAITDAVLRAAMPIATQDAQVFQNLQLKKLDLKAQSVFLKAGYISQLDMKNLDNRQQAAVVNAQNFLNMDLANLNNDQQAAVVSSQNRLQVMLSDQAAINAGRQFNATGQAQMDQYNASLATSLSEFNANQVNAMRQFNAGQSNAMTQFNLKQANDRDQFNTANSVLIDQSNTNYLRNINTQNTAAQNQANIINATNLVNISNTAASNMIQLLRDQTAFSFQSGENDLDRANQATLLNLQNSQWFQRYNAQQKDSLWKSVGGFVAGIAGDAIKGYINSPSTSGGGGSSGGGSSTADNWTPSEYDTMM